MIGQLLGGYRVLERIGEGPNGTVWKAEHQDLKTVVAIKVLPADLASRPSDRERFERGSRAAAKLNHPGIATVFGAEFSGSTPYIVSEFVNGETVNARTALGPLPPRQAVDLVLQAARALQHAHQQGVIHRDISGGNVMVTRDGRCKLVDFGIAVERDGTRKTTQGTVLGTWAYMAPEALRDEAASESRDTYALGVILYQLLTGRLPYVAETFEGLVYRILNDDARPPSAHVPGLPASLDRLVLRVLEKNPKLRITMGRLIRELEGLAAAGVLDVGTQPESTGLGSRIDRALGQVVRQWTTMAPSQTRKLLVMASVSIVSIGALGWLVARALPQGPVKPKVASLAIIPFFNESREAGFEHIGHGLAEHLAGRLGGLEGLLVQPYRKWVFGDAVELCEQLNVEGVLEGAFGVTGGEVEARIDLVKADGTREVIAHTQSGGYKQAAQDIASAAAKGLKSRLTTTEAAHIAVPAAGSNEAFDALSTAVDAHQRGDRDEALRWYERAVNLDPGLAKAYVGIGSIYYDRYFRGTGGASNLDIAKSNFGQALALEPDNSGAERGLILVHYERSAPDSGLVIARSAARRGASIDALLIQAWAYTFNLMPDLAVPLLERVIEQDPMNDEAYWLLVLAAAWDRQFERAVRAGEEYLGRFGEDPEVHVWMAMAQWNLGNMRMALSHFELALEQFGESTQLYVSLYAGAFYLETQNQTRAQEVLQAGLEVAEQRLRIAPDNPRVQAIFGVLSIALGRNTKGTSFIPQSDDVPILLPYAKGEARGEIMRMVLGMDAVHAVILRAVTPALDGEVLREPRLAKSIAAGRAYDDSLRRRYELPARPSPL